MKNKNILVMIVVAGVAVGSLVLLRNGMFTQFDTLVEANTKMTAVTSTLFTKDPQPVIEEPKTILAVGDIMLDRGVKNVVAKYGDGNYLYPFTFIKDRLTSADLAFGNLEGPISDVGVDSGKKYSFRFPIVAAEGISNAGFDVVALANNHALDWGYESLCATTKHLQDVKVGFVGAGCNKTEADKAYIKQLGNTSVGFLAFTEFYQGAFATDTRAGLAEWDLDNMTAQVEKLANEVDVVLVSIHWGEEYKTRSNAGQQKVGRALIDAGADVIIGHHPHVAQEIERYNNGWILYSLGNFVFDQSFSAETMKGLLAEITVQEGEILAVEGKTIYITPRFQPYVEGDYELSEVMP